MKNILKQIRNPQTNLLEDVFTIPDPSTLLPYEKKGVAKTLVDAEGVTRQEEDQNLQTQINGIDQSKWEPATIETKTIIYGRLYNWYAATDPRGIAPNGWHVPSQEEWQTLIDFAGTPITAFSKLSESSDTYWTVNEQVRTNELGFSALPGGCINGGTGNPFILGLGANFITTTLLSDDYERVVTFGYKDYGITFDQGSTFSFGGSIRLIKDNSINEGDVIIDGDTYHAVTIGDQVWLQQNLAVKHYQNGDLIGSDFSGTIGAVTAYNNDESNVYDIVQVEDSAHIQPKESKRINANIIDNLPIIDPNAVIDENYVHTDNNYTTTEKNKLAGINEYFRGTYPTLTDLKTAIPIGSEGNEAVVDAGIGSDPQKYIWDVSDQDWRLGSGTAITVDQSINEGSVNPVSGGSVFSGLAAKAKQSSTHINDPDAITTENPSGDVIADVDRSAFAQASITANSAATDDGNHVFTLYYATKEENDAKEDIGVASQLISEIQFLDILGYALSDQTTDITTGIKITDTILNTFTLTDILLSLSTAATGGIFTVNIKKNGVSIFTTKVTIDATELSNLTATTPYVLVSDSTTLIVGDRIEISVDAVGAVTTGKGAIIHIKGTL